jgi:hypothetical protein
MNVSAACRFALASPRVALARRREAATSLHLRHAATLDQPHSLKLELAYNFRLSMTTSGFH